MTHVRDNQGKPTTQVSLYQANYHWTYLEDDVGNGDHLLSPIYHWHAVFSSLPKYDSLGYEIYYYAVENTHVNAADFDYLDTAISYTLEGVLTEVGTQSAIDPGPIPTDEDGTPVAVLIPDGQSDAGRYALLEDGTFTNTASANVTVLGQKLWKTMPANYPAADLPQVDFTLVQSITDSATGVTTSTNIATLTIKNWDGLPVEDGAFHFGIAYTGANVVTVADDGSLKIEPAPGNDNAQPLPKYNENGDRYTYTLKETSITLRNGPDSSEVYLQPVINTYLVENGYRSIQGALSVKKFLELPLDNGTPIAYPAVQFALDRRYTRNNGSPSDWEEEVQTVTWTSAEVQEASKAAQDKTAPLENVLTFKNLDYYAPNGSRWEYRIREVTDGWLGGFTVTSAAGDVSDPNAITGESNTVEGLGLTPDEEGGSTAGTVTAAATFYNRPAADRAAIVLQGTKIWEDFDNAFSTRPEELAITVSRYAPSQPEQNNGIDLEEVSPDLYEIRWNKPSGSSTWSYTITGKAGTVGLEQFAPNGMRWVYRIEETIPSRYTSPSDGEAWASREPLQDNVYIVDPLTNTVARTVSYQKQWINSDGNAVSEDYLGVDLTVQFLLQVREEGTGSAWTDAETFFRTALGDTEYNRLFAGYNFTPSLTGRINDTGSWSGRLENLPVFLMRGTQEITLSYRIVETGISWGTGADETISIGVTENTDGSWSYVFAGSALFAPGQTSCTLPAGSGAFVIRNRLDTTSITARKIWEGDSDNAYGTRPVTGRTTGGYTWEVNLLVQYSTDQTSWTTLTTRDAAGTTHPVILHIYGDNADSEGTVTLAGPPTHTLSGQEITYRIRELRPDPDDNAWWYRPERTAAEAEAAIVGSNETFNDAYTASYPPNDNLTVTNRFGEGQTFHAVKTWIGPDRTALNVELQYLERIEADGNGEEREVWTSFPIPAVVELNGTPCTSEPRPFYYAESAWTAVWTYVPLVMPGSYRGANGTDNTRYRIVETVPSGYQTSDGKTGQIPYEVTGSEPTAAFTNVKTTSLTVEKKWGTALSSTSLPSITVQLYASTNPDDAEAGRADAGLIVRDKTLTLKSENKWTATFTGLPLYTADGDPIYYYAKEIQIAGKDLVKAADGCYLVTIGSKEHHFRFSFDTTTTGSYKTTLVNVEYSDITGTKSWKDNSNAYGTRPDGITLALYRKAGTGAEEVVNGADGKPLQPTWVKSGNTWTFIYDHLPQANAQGEAYTYRVEEIQTTGPAGGDQYTVTQNGMNLTNTLTGTVNLQVEKLWQDNDNALGLRPEEIIVELCVNGSPDPTRTLTLTAANDWKGSFDGLAKYDSNGALIRYSVREESQSMPLGYRVYYGEAVTGTPESSEEPVYQFTNVADGAVTLTKKVSGSRGDTSKAFTFTFTLTSGLPSTAPADAYPYTITRQDGTQETGVIRSGETFTLRHNESITISKLPGNAAYQFTESDNTGYQVSSTGASGTVLPGSTISASFENYRGGGGGGGHDPDPDPDPRHDHPTPSPDPELPYTGQDWRTVGLLSAGGVILLSLGLFRRRKDHEPSQPE